MVTWKIETTKEGSATLYRWRPKERWWGRGSWEWEDGFPSKADAETYIQHSVPRSLVMETSYYEENGHQHYEAW